MIPTAGYLDSLLVTEFGLSIAASASITGVQFDIRRATMFGNGEDYDSAFVDSVRVTIYYEQCE